jgi:hypothetical protein
VIFFFFFLVVVVVVGEREIEGVVKIVKSTNCDLGERIIAQVVTHK